MQKNLKKGDIAPNFEVKSPWLKGLNSFYDKNNKTPSVIYFLRYYGCLICQLDIKKIRDNIKVFNQQGYKVFVIIQSTVETLENKTEKNDWNFNIVCDPKSVIYKEYGVSEGNLFQFLHPVGLPKVIQSLRSGNKHGKFEGEETQLPAVFRINSDKIIEFAYYGKHISDIPDFQKVLF